MMNAGMDDYFEVIEIAQAFGFYLEDSILIWARPQNFQYFYTDIGTRNEKLYLIYK